MIKILHGFNGLKRIKRIGADLAKGLSAPIRLIRFNPLNPCLNPDGEPAEGG